MSNRGIPAKSRKVTAPNKSTTAHSMWLGWNDCALGNSYPKQYDGWCESEQRNYEIGRVCAASFKAKLRTIPKWKRDVSITTALNGIDASAYADFIAENRFQVRGIPNLPAS